MKCNKIYTGKALHGTHLPCTGRLQHSPWSQRSLPRDRAWRPQCATGARGVRCAAQRVQQHHRGGQEVHRVQLVQGAQPGRHARQQRRNAQTHLRNARLASSDRAEGCGGLG